MTQQDTLNVVPVEGRLILNPDDNFSPVDKPVTVFRNMFWLGAIRDGDVKTETDEQRDERVKQEEADAKKAEDERAAAQKVADDAAAAEKAAAETKDETAETKDEPVAPMPGEPSLDAPTDVATNKRSKR